MQRYYIYNGGALERTKRKVPFAAVIRRWQYSCAIQRPGIPATRIKKLSASARGVVGGSGSINGETARYAQAKGEEMVTSSRGISSYS